MESQMNVSNKDKHLLITYCVQYLAMSAVCEDILSLICNQFSAQEEVIIGLGIFSSENVLRSYERKWATVSQGPKKI